MDLNKELRFDLLKFLMEVRIESPSKTIKGVELLGSYKYKKILITKYENGSRKV